MTVVCRPNPVELRRPARYVPRVLDDRDYMRPAENTFRHSITFYLTAAIVLGFILQCLVLLASGADLANFFVLRREEFFTGQI